MLVAADVVTVPPPNPRRIFDTFLDPTVGSTVGSTVSCPVPSRLRMCLALWRSTDPHCAQLIQLGMLPDWITLPPVINRGDSAKHCTLSSPAAMQLEIDLLVESGAVRIVPKNEPIPDRYVISRVFPVPKKDGRVRLVINLKTINPYVPAVHFKMEGLRSLRDVIRWGDWMTKLDLQDAFHHLPIHPKAKPFFRFQWKDTLYEWQAVPFGYRDAPRVFTRVMRAVATAARQLGIRLIVYMDDILILSHSQEQAIKDRDTVLQLLQLFGWSLNIKKCHFIPTQLIDFLGVMVDSVKMLFFLPQKKVDALRARVQAMRLRALKGKRIPLFQLQSLVGHLQSVSDCILPTRLHSNALIEALRIAQLYHYTTLSQLASTSCYGGRRTW